MKILAVAPMDGITNNAFRNMVSGIWEKHGDKNKYQMYMWTEFMSVEGYSRHPDRLAHHLLSDMTQNNLIAQIYGSANNPENLINTAIDIDQKYDNFAGVELNIGCPSPSVYNCESGVGMLLNRDKTGQIISQISQNIKKPFSIKTRTGLNEDDKMKQFEWILSVAKFCDMITLHGRTYKGGHSGDVDRQYIYNLKSELSKIKNNKGNDILLLGNGGLNTYNDGVDRIGNLDGVMRGQGVMKNPFVIADYKPHLQEIYDTIMQHLDLYICDHIYMNCMSSFDYEQSLLIQPSMNIYNDIILSLHSKNYLDLYTKNRDDLTGNLGDFHAVVEFRKHLFWYIGGLPGNREFKQKVASIKNYYLVKKEIDIYFAALK